MKQFKVVGVISSPRADGNTAGLVRAALKGAQNKGADIEEIFLAECNMQYCKGCQQCLRTGSCWMQDDFMDIREKLYQADGIIWGAPTYCGGPNAIMKNLTDRLGLYEVMTSSLGGKHMAVISTAGAADAAVKTAKSMEASLCNGIFLSSSVSGIVGAGYNKKTTAAEMENARKKATMLGEKLTVDIREDKKYPMQHFVARMATRLFARNIFTTFIQKEKEGDTKAVYDSLLARGFIKNPG